MTVSHYARLTPTYADIEEAMGRLALLIALARGHVAVRGTTNVDPIAAALVTAADALGHANAAADPRLLARLHRLTESLAALLEELAETAAVQPMPAVA
jgi:hypothetical protein